MSPEVEIVDSGAFVARNLLEEHTFQFIHTLNVN